jgi:hypothetical protein
MATWNGITRGPEARRILGQNRIAGNSPGTCRPHGRPPQWLPSPRSDRLAWFGCSYSPIRNGMDSDRRMSKTGASPGQAQAEAPRAPRPPAGEVSIRCGAGGARSRAGHHPLHQPVTTSTSERAVCVAAVRACARAGWLDSRRAGGRSLYTAAAAAGGCRRGTSSRNAGWLRG